MKRNADSIVGNRVVTTEGEIGKVDEFYFDDETWTIRYIVVKMEEGRKGRKVLISVDLLVKDDPEPGVFFVTCTKEQILDSPLIDMDKPVSRQQENELYWHYGGKRYWEDGLCEGGLHGTLFMIGFRVCATDVEIGCICDFILDSDTWKLLFLVVHMRQSPSGEKVLIPIEHLLKTSWDDAEAYLDETGADTEKSEVFHAARFSMAARY